MSTFHTRRAFLRLTAVGAAGALLAACAPKVVEVTKIVEKEKVVKETVVVKEEVKPAGPEKKIVRFILSSWAVGERFPLTAWPANSTSKTPASRS